MLENCSVKLPTPTAQRIHILNKCTILCAGSPSQLFLAAHCPGVTGWTRLEDHYGHGDYSLPLVYNSWSLRVELEVRLSIEAE